MGALENNNHQNSLFTHFYTIVYALIVHDNAAVCMYYVMCVCVCVCVGLRAVVLEMMGHDGNEDVLPGGRENMNTFVKNTTPQIAIHCTVSHQCSG